VLVSAINSDKGGEINNQHGSMELTAATCGMLVALEHQQAIYDITCCQAYAGKYLDHNA
jgi:hypothetical protein